MGEWLLELLGAILDLVGAIVSNDEEEK
ncbi:hypothetical protein [Bacillus phage vB_BceM_Bc431v3]|uniref:Uncharacterized protein n=1 Tax=Bacillus phage vB_BceM_Bc431v3 TaxID=1195072 RepID=M4HNM6_9CAUD|nr:hypothetical protein K201_gp083 [Bacillus phage vB_BceM_Bc431v3]AFQ96391.1 hypothetical protein [Bacillus phage vB_BceM_Bc431v3]